MKDDGRDGARASSGCSRRRPAPPAATRRATRSPGCAATSCSRARPTRRRAAATARLGRRAPARVAPRRRRAQRVRRRVGRRSRGRRFYPIQVAEKGFAVYRITRPRHVGPRLDAARRTTRPSSPRRSSSASPCPGRPALTPVMARFLDRGRRRAAGRRRARPARRSPATTPAASRGRARARCATRCTPAPLRALLRDTISPDVIHAGVKYNVIPGEPTVEVDCRVLPGHDRGRDARRGRRAGSADLAAACEIELIVSARRSRRRPRARSTTLLGRDDPRPRPGRRSRCR